MCMNDRDKNASVVQLIVLFMLDNAKKINIYVYVCDGSTWPIIFIRLE